METSDSECFESADEDFDSDYEEEKEKPEKIKGHNVSHKMIEPEVCKLKGDESAKGIGLEEKYHEADLMEKVQNSSKSPSSKEGSIMTSTLVSHKANKILKNDEHINEKLQIDKRPENKLIENDNKKVENSLNELQETKDSRDKQNNNSLINSQKNISEIESKQELSLNFKVEENLWNADEIDWKSEAAKEESQKTEEHSPNSKNEDSGWDDFDIEWESEGTSVSPDKSLESKSKCITSKVQADCNLKPEINLLPVTENMWEDDDWEPLEKPEDKPKPSEAQSGWGGWGNWGVSSLLNTATQSVSTLTSHVSQGLSTVLETGIGIPNPEEMAKIDKFENDEEKPDEQKKEKLKDVNEDSSGFGLDNLVSGMSQLTKFVESTGTKVITGGLDTLEAIGKKTVEVLQEGDPGLKKKRAFLKLDTGKPNLSQILREAKEQAEKENEVLQQKYTEVKKTKNYEALFDDHQGLVHLEALEMLSRLCSIKLSNLDDSLGGESLKDMQETLDQVKELCELPEDEEEDKISMEEGRETITNAVKEMNIPISYDKLFLTCEEADKWINTINLDFIDDVELHQQAIETLAQFTALAMEQFHKTGELLLVKEHRSTADEADSLVQITTTLKSLIVCQAGKFTDKLNTLEHVNHDNISEHITNIFYEAANSGRYIQDAFQLLIPVLQVGAV